MTQEIRIAKSIEALLLGYEIGQKDKTLIITEDNRIGYIVGEIFYEQTFSEFVSILSSLTEKEFIGIVAFLGITKK